MENNKKKRKCTSVLYAYHSIFNELSSTDEDSDEEEIEMMLNRLLQSNRIGNNRTVPVRMRDFVERTVPTFTDKEFQSHFRMNRTTFNWLMRQLSPHLVNSAGTGRQTTAVEKQLLAVIWFLSTPDSYRFVDITFFKK